MNTVTSNVNFLQQVNFKLTIINPNFSNLEYFCTAANIPAASMQEITQNYQNDQSFFPGDQLNFEQLKVKFMVDENMTNYVEVLNWLTKNTMANANQFPSRCDLILSVLSSKNTINRQFQFTDAFPTSLGELAFNTQAQTVEYISCDMSLRFNRFKVLL